MGCPCSRPPGRTCRPSCNPHVGSRAQHHQGDQDCLANPHWFCLRQEPACGLAKPHCLCLRWAPAGFLAQPCYLCRKHALTSSAMGAWLLTWASLEPPVLSCRARDSARGYSARTCMSGPGQEGASPVVVLGASLQARCSSTWQVRTTSRAVMGSEVHRARCISIWQVASLGCLHPWLACRTKACITRLRPRLPLTGSPDSINSCSKMWLACWCQPPTVHHSLTCHTDRLLYLAATAADLVVISICEHDGAGASKPAPDMIAPWAGLTGGFRYPAALQVLDADTLSHQRLSIQHHAAGTRMPAASMPPSMPHLSQQKHCS